MREVFCMFVFAVCPVCGCVWARYNNNWIDEKEKQWLLLFLLLLHVAWPKISWPPPLSLSPLPLNLPPPTRSCQQIGCKKAPLFLFRLTFWTHNSGLSTYISFLQSHTMLQMWKTRSVLPLALSISLSRVTPCVVVVVFVLIAST